MRYNKTLNQRRCAHTAERGQTKTKALERLAEEALI